MLSQIYLSAGYDCLEAGDGQEGLALFKASRPPLTVTDLKMPVMDGIQLVAAVRALRLHHEAGERGGAPHRVRPGARAAPAPHRAAAVPGAAGAAREEATRDVQLAYRQLKDTYRATLESLGAALDSRDVGTESHSRRVHGYALATARAHGVPEDELADLAHGVLLHDIGKIGIPDAILLKPGPLTKDEWTIMRTHPEIGRRLIENIPFLKGAVPIVYCHHERWDGNGYPTGLREEQIPLGARIFAVVDAFDAMTFDRPYSKAISFEAAKAEIVRCAGSHFDPAVVTSFVKVPDALLQEIRQKSVGP